MGKQTGTLEQVVRQVGVLLRGLSQVLTPEEIHLLLLANVGLDVPVENLRQAAFTEALNECATTAGELPSLISDISAAIESDDPEQILRTTGHAIDQVQTVVGYSR